jgi:hypothetical protein
MIQATIDSYGFNRAESCRHFNAAFQNVFEGWNVMFRFPCSVCGVWHASNTKNAWKSTQRDVVKYTCPATNQVVEVEITKR